VGELFGGLLSTTKARKGARRNTMKIFFLTAKDAKGREGENIQERYSKSFSFAFLRVLRGEIQNT